MSIAEGASRKVVFNVETQFCGSHVPAYNAFINYPVVLVPTVEVGQHAETQGRLSDQAATVFVGNIREAPAASNGEESAKQYVYNIEQAIDSEFS